MISTAIDKILTDFISSLGVTPLWTCQGDRPAFPYCELSLQNIKDANGMHETDRVKTSDVRFRIFTENDSAFSRTDGIINALEDFDIRATLKPLYYVAVLSDVISVNYEEEGKYIYSCYVDIRFSYGIEKTYNKVARVSGNYNGTAFDINLEEE